MKTISMPEHEYHEELNKASSDGKRRGKEIVLLLVEGMLYEKKFEWEGEDQSPIQPRLKSIQDIIEELKTQHSEVYLHRGKK